MMNLTFYIEAYMGRFDVCLNSNLTFLSPIQITVLIFKKNFFWGWRRTDLWED